MEEIADATVAILREFINAEQQFVTEEHNLHDKLCAVDHIFAFLDEKIPENLGHLHNLNHKIYKGILKLRDFIEENSLVNVQFLQEGNGWKAVSEKAGELVSVNGQLLKEFHDLFVELADAMAESELIKAVHQDLGNEKPKEDYVSLEEHYFAEVYKFLRAYEGILRRLWQKEKDLNP